MKVYNTLTGKKEEFKPRDPGQVSIYVCGPTVYNYIHIGNARAYVAFDTIIRYLKHKGLQVKYVRNLTDVDDKIIKRAHEEKTTTEAITTKYTQAFHKDMEALNVAPPDVEPKATEHIKDMVATIQKLIDNGLAYEIDGDVYFSVENFADYGKLSKRSLDDMIAGARVEVDERKKNPADFALWKKAKEHEPSWPSPWGMGRPGWHIECSVMSQKYLGAGFDIHGGGQDLIFPHHENEIAQAEGATGKKPFVHYWLHNGFLNVEAEKMAKSVGNVILIKNLEEQYNDNPDDLKNDLRMLFLQTHYHSPLNFSLKELRVAAETTRKMLGTFWALKFIIDKTKSYRAKEPLILEKLFQNTIERFEKVMEDDFNTPMAIATIFDFINEINVNINDQVVGRENIKEFQKAYDLLYKLTCILGFSYKTISYPKWVEKDLEIREEARKKKDFNEADKIRDKLFKSGIVIEDTPYGPRPSPSPEADPE